MTGEHNRLREALDELLEAIAVAETHGHRFPDQVLKACTNAEAVLEESADYGGAGKA